MNTFDDSQWTFDDDEMEHISKLHGDILERLQKTEKAAVLTINGINSIKTLPFIYEPEGHISLWLVKSARNVRLAVKGLKLGYYSGVAGVLRAAFEDLTFIALINSEPSQLAKLYRNEFSPQIRKEDRESLRGKQRGDAKAALFSQEKAQRIIRDGLREYCEAANFNLHTSIRGLSEEFGINIEELIPKELRDELLDEEDMQKALDRFVLKTSFSDYVQNNKLSEDEKDRSVIYIELSGRYDENQLYDLVGFPFYIAHRLLDFTKDIFKVKDKDFNDQYDDWHSSIRD